MVEDSSKIGKFGRREFLRTAGGGLVLIAGGQTLVGCGGGGGGSNVSTGSGVTGSLGGNGNGPFTQTVMLGTGASTITDKASGIILTVAANSVSRSTSFTIMVSNKQVSGVTPQGFASNPNGINISIDPTALTKTATISVTIPWALPYSLIGTGVYLMNASGKLMLLDVSYNASAKTVTATFGAAELNAIATTGSGVQQYALFLASANFVDVAPGKAPPRTPFSASTSVRRARQNRTTRSTLGRVAVAIHGINSKLVDMTPVVNYLQSFTLPTNSSDPNGQGATGKVYDHWSSWEYDWTQGIATNGLQFATYLSDRAANADVVDIYAHSMGGLVSRYALEQVLPAGTINQLITLGTPHRGVPARALALLVYDLSLLGRWVGVGTYFAAILAALAAGVTASTYLLAPGLFDLLDTSEFIKDLNSKRPTTDPATYRNLVGTSHANFIFGLGDYVDTLYQRIMPGVLHDGIVPAPSAQLLSNLASVHFVSQNHSQLVDNIASGSSGPSSNPEPGTIGDWIVVPASGVVN